MLIDHDNENPIYVIGTAVPTFELAKWIQADTEAPVIIVGHEEVSSIPKNSSCFLSFWTLDYRNKFFRSVEMSNYKWPSYVHPKSCVNDINSIQSGSVIFPMSQIGHGVVCGSFLYLSSMSTISHGAQLGSNVVISPQVVIGGSSKIGNNVLFGQSSSIAHKISIVDDCKFAMTSAVTKNITAPGNYYSNKRINTEI
jgi:acetyltransferase-like isoleucine patch superfamily enzyme